MNLYWFYILYVAIFILIASIVFAILDYHFNWTYCRTPQVIGIAVSTLALIVCAIVIPCSLISNAQNTAVFIRQKSYIESHVAKNSIEDAALTNTKISENEWLYNAQWWIKSCPGWCLYPKSVKELTPIN